MKRAALRYAEAMAKLLDVLDDPSAEGHAIRAGWDECAAADAALMVLLTGGDLGAARDELERCKRLHALLQAKASSELATTGRQLGQVRERRRSLPLGGQKDAEGLSCDLSA